MRFHKIVLFILLVWCFSVFVDTYNNVVFGQVLITEDENIQSSCLSDIYLDDTTVEGRATCITQIIDSLYQGDTKAMISLKTIVGTTSFPIQTMSISQYLYSRVPQDSENNNWRIYFEDRNSITEIISH